MKKDIFNFLKSYSCDTYATNRLIVSSFLNFKGIERVNNKFINSFIIQSDAPDFEQLKLFNENHKITSIEELITAFEFVISPEEKVITGAVYTPELVRKFIVNEVIDDDASPNSLTICDPACGCGGFLYTAASSLRKMTNLSFEDIFLNCLFGIDLKDYSITRSKILLSLMAIFEGEDKPQFNFNLHVGNSLGFNWNEHIDGFNGFDAIVGNPPYVCSRNIDDESKSLLKNWKVSSTGHPDLYIPFFEIGLSLLKESGKLGYITMNSFFKSLNGRAIRKYFNEEQFLFEVFDFGGFQVFDSRSTYTCICLISNSKSDHIEYKKINSLDDLNKQHTQKIQYDLLDDHRGWNFQSFDLVHRIENIGKPFSKVFKASSGIATLKNNVYIFDYINEDRKFYYLKNDIKIEKNICQDVINPNKLIKNDDINSIRKKIIFPYTYDNKGLAVVIPEHTFKDKYSNTYKYLMSCKKILDQRDKGNGNYPEWYAYGRKQSLEKYPYKLFFPHITPTIPNFVLNDDDSLLFRNGMALVSDNINHLKLAQKIMQSRLFWFYIINTSRPYGSGYFSISRNYIKAFGIYDFTDEQIFQLINEEDQSKVDIHLEQIYGISLSDEMI